jgi:hypothetical protein
VGPIRRVDRDCRRSGVRQSVMHPPCESGASRRISKTFESVTDAVPHFHNKYRHFHTKKSRNPLAFFEIGSMLQINGREIFQRERVDKELSENRKRDSRSSRETGGFGWNRESSCNAVIEEESGKRGFTPVGPEQSRSDKALWSGSRTRPSKNRKKGRDPAREIAPSLLFRSSSSPPT